MPCAGNCLYGTHGLHEYRGRFFLPLVRSLINISGTCPGGIVADPMNGSGTTVAEAIPANSVDVVITPPPYATAWPYLDTDRLSLCYLGLLPRPEHRLRLMIGNRGIPEGVRKGDWERFLTDRTILPAPVRELIWRIERLNSGAKAGFRRRRLPALLAVARQVFF